MTLDKHSWGYRPNARLDDFLTNEELINGIKMFLFELIIRFT